MISMTELTKKDDSMDESSFEKFKTFLINAEAVEPTAIPVDLELDKAVDQMVVRWLNSTKVVFPVLVLENLKLLCKKIHYHRFEAKESRGCWEVLKSNIL
jgi:hypothetical protein